jgi:CRP-like cAMP-binding protein
MAAPVSSNTGDIFRHLSVAQRATIEAHMSWIAYPEGAIIHTPYNQQHALFLLQTGKVQVYKCTTEVRILQLFVLEPVTLFGEMTMFGQWSSFARAVTRCVVGRMEHTMLREMIAQSPGLALDVMQMMGQRLREMENKLVDLAFKHVPQRLATVLINLAGGMTDSPSSTVEPLVVRRYTHQQLAEMIGSYRETVTKIIGEFRDAGLIRVENDVIYLTDLAALLELVQG